MSFEERPDWVETIVGFFVKIIGGILFAFAIGAVLWLLATIFK